MNFSCSVIGLLDGLGVQCIHANCTVQFSCMTPSFEDDGRPSIVGPDVSATYHWVWTHLGGP